ncbi:heteromeric transposase endonuclease subunit TnsA [Xanthomonas campestris pv. campestris]|uniref:heteromeric transposase endonuclease subunit TnsA n=1 Tax=Xanthomonas campestris TaxID=339 RepID=UPI000838FA59|nr:heteromeric transposase endonuclease subunit TnsA [Xanthomonas campestris]MCC5051392.1 heteromeric transposase endonuclease subunit TnsA [Xanthomonas campestris pv. aberrans]MCF8868941.1 heteromeric transposase endonuclease subunit TnsA [Xanthomonas campestris pv. campestris]MDM7672288.1 heteromeric transposase endonuclease subunit TnsA [Xanthomonas campestris pv. campestris]MDM7693084.1 heteromeric transposase endonuclease subunit TnsA [Xanthomonas campestris pv. campestris]MDM7714613.1 he
MTLGDGGVAAFESSLERDWLLALDFDPRVQAIQVQPFSLHYEHRGATRRYTPDVRADYRLESGMATVVYEVKPSEELRLNWSAYRPRFKAAVRYCRDHGWRFKLVTERHIRTALLDNARFLRRYRALPEQDLYVQQLLYTLRALGTTTPQALLAAAYWAEESRMAALPMLWKLIATGRLGADLHVPLTMSAPIWLPGSSG